MKNREIYTTEPRANRILNQGVAEVTEDRGERELSVLRYELETFICEGQYQKGMDRILGSYLSCLGSNQPEQKGVWISGFYGSGKSHLAKMLRILWTDYTFGDGVTARKLAHLPGDIQDHLRELSTASRRDGAGLFAAAGKMGGGGSESVRLVLLGILYRSAGFPEQYGQARLLLWLRDEGKLDSFTKELEARGRDLRKELHNLFVSPHVAAALRELYPGAYADETAVRQALKSQYAQPADISDGQMIAAIEQLLMRDGKLPLTLILLDELQQYIGTDPQRAYAVQLVTEACCKHFGSRVLFVGTGQSALSDTDSLQRLLARFPVKIQLSEEDVDTVIRRIILAKKPSAVEPLKKEIDKRLGEIARHLQGSTLAHTQRDEADLIPDYPLLPTRRRFWEQVLRTLDPTGTIGQLRNQLRVVDEAVLQTADHPVGTVVGGEFVFDQIAEALVSSHAISRDTYTAITKLSGSRDPEEILMGRVLKVAFLVNKLPDKPPTDLKLRATPDTIADLLVEKLAEDSSELRRRVPGLVKMLVDRQLLMAIDGDQGVEYRVQTRESAEWYDELESQRAKLRTTPSAVAIKKSERVRSWFDGDRKSFSVQQGSSGERREPGISYAERLASDTGLCVWVREGWKDDEKSVLSDARSLGSSSSAVVVYLPDEASDDLYNAIVTATAAQATIDVRGAPKGSEGEDARRSIESQRDMAEARIREIVDSMMDKAKVWLGGGRQVSGGMTLVDLIREGVEQAVERLYPRFGEGDSPGWSDVLAKAQKGNRDALKALHFADGPQAQPVCQALLDAIGPGMRGNEVRSTFEAPPYGWSKDAVDGAIYVLLANELLTATDSANHAKSYSASTLRRSDIAKVVLRREDEPIGPNERIALRSLYKEAGVGCASGEELAGAASFLAALERAAGAAGGAAPLPEPPKPALLQDLLGKMGNAQLRSILDAADKLKQLHGEWSRTAALVAKRAPSWESLRIVVSHLEGITEGEPIASEYGAILHARSLLSEPDPTIPLVKKGTDLLRSELNRRVTSYASQYQHLLKALESDESWKRTPESDRASILASTGVAAPRTVDVSGTKQVLERLAERDLGGWADFIDALPQRFSAARKEAIGRLEPDATSVELPHRTIRTQSEAEAWLAEVRKVILDGLKKGPLSF